MLFFLWLVGVWFYFKAKIKENPICKPGKLVMGHNKSPKNSKFLKI